jgi:hypothetical protein
MSKLGIDEFAFLFLFTPSDDSWMKRKTTANLHTNQ